MKTQEQARIRQSTKWGLCLAAILMLGPCIAQAQAVDISDGNSSLRYNRREPFTLETVPTSPIQFPDTIEWTVDGRRILVYPSIPGNSMDIEHIHPGSHVAGNQIHVQGPLFGYAREDVTVGIVYTVTGGASGSGESRISEKVDIRNKSSTPVSLGSLTGLGWLPDRSAPHNANLELPDLTGLTVTGTTIAFTQGDISGGTPRPLITDPPFGPVTVLPAASFTGFNPFLARNITLAPGATLTIVTELKVARPSEGTTSSPDETGSGGTGPSIPENATPDMSSPSNQSPSGGTEQSPSDGVHQDPWKKMHHGKHDKPWSKKGEDSTHTEH
ncbi:MAG TPA: hypothetical protein VEC35_03560 [Noviherbaspirillum sp.]|nr:hypothetical protein [Noviherbaspirillum sp.]